MNAGVSWDVCLPSFVHRPFLFKVGFVGVTSYGVAVEAHETHQCGDEVRGARLTVLALQIIGVNGL